MNRRLLLAVSASALILAGTLPATALAAGPKTPQKVDISKIDPSFRPMVLAGADRAVTVILQLDGRPAVRVGGTPAAQQAQAKTLRTAQGAIASAVAKRGGRVQATYQYAYNGLRVRTTAGKLDDLAAIPGVVAVRPVRVYERTNATGGLHVNAPATWTAGATGDGVLIAVLDTGIDYTHANFGGPGTELAFTGNDGSIVEPGTFPTPKVVGGMDLVGDAYDADSDDPLESMPVPDGDPLDCGGHGSHVAGTAAGFGVKADHSTYTGIYDEATMLDPSDFTIAPGVAPEAKLFAVKVFGCEGSTDVIVDALDKVGKYNVEHIVDIDVVNMSLGSSFGVPTDPDAVAANNLVAAGVTVVASAGNEGAVDYITGAPAVATRAISVAALDAVPTLPMATVELAGGNVSGLNQNDYPALPVNGTLDVIGTGGVVELGCDAADFGDATGKVVVVKRGVCAFVDKGDLAQDAGAVGIIVINRDDLPEDALPAFLGYNPEIFDIPMIGTTNASEDALVAADGQAVTLSEAGPQPNPAYRQIAAFSSSGPRWGDSWLKADVAAPGVSVYSTSVGTGWNGTTYSGTSMAAPMTAGAAALVIQAHPAWSPLRVKAALSNTADHADVLGYTVLRSGSGAIRADRAARANVIATTSDGTASLNYGYIQATRAWSSAKKITITNDGPTSAKYTLASSSSSVKLSTTSVTVPARSSVTVTATAALSTKTVTGLCSPDQWAANHCGALYTRSGAITATPVGTKAGQYALRVPFLIAPRGASSVTSTRSSTWTKSGGKISGRINLANTSYHAGTADVYALGLTDASGDAKVEGVLTRVNGTDIRAAGVQVFGSSDPSDRELYFAVNMHDRFSTAAPHEIDVLINNDADPDPEYVIVAIDLGLLDGAYAGVFGTLTWDVDLEDWVTIDDGDPETADPYLAWEANAPLNGSTILLPSLASTLGLSAGDGSFTYQLVSYDGFTGAEDETGVSRAFDAYAPKQSTGQWKAMKGRTASTSKISTSVGAWFYRVSSVRGWLVVTMDDKNGSYQADIVTIPSKP